MNHDMKLGPVTKLNKKNKTTEKSLMMMSSQKIMTPSWFFVFLSNLEQSAGRISDTESAEVTFLLIVTFFS